VQVDPVHGSNLREYLALLRTRKWTIILIATLVVTSTFYFSYRQTPLYRAETRILVKALPSDPQSLYTVPVNLDTESQIVASEPVALLVSDDLGGHQLPDELLNGLSAQGVTNTEVLTIAYTSPDPRFARDAANAFARNYLTYREREAAKVFRAVKKVAQRQVESATRQLADLTASLREAQRSNDSVTAAALETQRSTLIARLGILQQRLEDVQANGGGRLSGGQIIEPAQLPSSPSSPNYAQNLLMGGLLGVAFGVGMAFLRDRLEKRFRSRSDIEQALNAPVLAMIPKFRTRKRKATSRLVVVADPSSTASESYRTLRTNIQFITSQGDTKSLVVTSPSAGEGKTVTTANLGLAFADAGSNVLVVSGDLRRPALAHYIGVGNGHGLSDYLAGRVDDLWSLIKTLDKPALHVLPSGTVPPNPAELLASARFKRVVAELEDKFDAVLFDSPPTLPVADAVILGARVSATIMVIDANTTHRSATARAKEELERVGARIIGSVLNAFDPSDSPYYYEPYYLSQYRGESAQGQTNGRADVAEAGMSIGSSRR
jgi:capsular exopolysaccharide synthesis family protein